MTLELIPENVLKIREAIERAEGSMDVAKGAVQVAIRDRVMAGKLLLIEREKNEYGEWQKWLAHYLPDFSYETASRWMKLARFAETRGADLEDAASVRQAYVLAGLLPEPQSSTAPAAEAHESYLTHLVRSATHLSAQLSQRPITDWPLEERRILRDRLAPLVQVYEQLTA